MADKPDGGKGPEGNNNAGVKLHMRKLSFMNPFTSSSKTDNSMTSSPSSETASSKAESPKQKKSLTNKESLGSLSASDIDDDILTKLNVQVQYLGKMEMKSPGYNDICDTVTSTYSRAKPYLKTMEKSTLIFDHNGITIKNEPINTKHHTPNEHQQQQQQQNPDSSLLSNPDLETLYKARRILFCGVDKTHQKLFFFNYQYASRASNVHLHMVVCKSSKDAKELAQRCSHLFKKIQQDLHKKDKEKREDHIQEIQKIRTKSNQNLPSSAGSSKDGSCSGTCGSGEWVQERVGLSMA